MLHRTFAVNFSVCVSSLSSVSWWPAPNTAISGVAEWGVFVEENETKCEGLIRISDLGNDYYVFEREKYRIVGKQSKATFTLGDKLKFRVKAVDLEKKSIDYELVK